MSQLVYLIHMVISSLQLEAFTEVIRQGSFSKAAASLHVTQSALSQRISNLEAELGATLVIREPNGLRLTPEGEELLRYGQIKDQLEQETLRKLGALKHSGGGRIRIAGFSTVMRSVVMPLLEPWLLANPEVDIECLTRELYELPAMLRSGEADLILTTEKTERQDWESHLLGHEENVMVERKKGAVRKGTYLDHDAQDNTTFAFLKLNGIDTKSIRRSFLDDIYSILDGAKLGWGRAVVPKHLIRNDLTLKIISGHKSLRFPVYVQHFRQPYYSSLHHAVKECLVGGASRLLN